MEHPHRVRKIDIHTHILPDSIPDFSTRFGYGDWVSVQRSDCGCKANMFVGGRFFRAVEENCWSASKRIDEMDAQDLQVQVLSTVPVMFSYWAEPEHALELSVFLNDHIASVCKQYPSRFVGLGTVPLQNPEMAIAEMRRCKELGLVGIQIGSHVKDWTLAEPALFPFFAAAAALDMSIFVHPWDMVGQDLMRRYWLPWLVGMPAETSMAICSFIFGGIFERLPTLRVCFAHGGGAFPATLGRIEHAYHVRPDLCAVDNPFPPSKYLGHFWVDSLVHDDSMMRVIVNMIGSKRVCLGTDYPFPLGEAVAGQAVQSTAVLSEAEKQDLLWKSALRFLNVPESRFGWTPSKD